MRALCRCLLPLLTVLGLALGAVPATAATPAVGLKPWTIPALKQWTGAPGEFRFDAATRVVAGAPALAATAQTFAADLSALTGRHVPVADRLAQDQPPVGLEQRPEVEDADVVEAEFGDLREVRARGASSRWCQAWNQPCRGV